MSKLICLSLDYVAFKDLCFKLTSSEVDARSISNASTDSMLLARMRRIEVFLINMVQYSNISTAF